jgi:hypothetical protein
MENQFSDKRPKIGRTSNLIFSFGAYAPVLRVCVPRNFHSLFRKGGNR